MNDLVERLRGPMYGMFSKDPERAADRIEELEAQRDELVEALNSTIGVCQGFSTQSLTAKIVAEDAHRVLAKWKGK